MKVLSVIHMLYVQDMKRAINFYVNALGFTCEEESEFWSSLVSENGKIGLTSYGEYNEFKLTNLIIEVDDYDEALKRIKELGGIISEEHQPYEGAPIHNAEIIDTENNGIVISKKL